MHLLYTLLAFALGAAVTLAVVLHRAPQDPVPSADARRTDSQLSPGTGDIPWPLQNGGRQTLGALVQGGGLGAPAVREQEPVMRKIQGLLDAGQEAAALHLYRRHCRAGPRADACKSIFINYIHYLFENNLQRLSRLLDAWLELETEDPPAVFYQGAMYAQQGRPRDALQRLLDLRLRPQDEVPQTVIDNAVQTVFQQHIARLQRQKNPQPVLDFLNFMHGLDPGNPRYRYLQAETLLAMKRHFEAINTLEEILYDPDWGPQAQELAATIEQRLAQESQVQVPLIRSGEHFLVRTNISGAEVLLLLDTGASYTAVDRRTFRQLGVPSRWVRSVLLHTPNGNVPAPLVRVDRFGVVGGPEFRDVEIALMSLGNLPESQGLLGMNYLRRFDFYIDQDDAVLYLGQRN